MRVQVHCGQFYQIVETCFCIQANQKKIWQQYNCHPSNPIKSMNVPSYQVLACFTHGLAGFYTLYTGTSFTRLFSCISQIYLIINETIFCFKFFNHIAATSFPFFSINKRFVKQYALKQLEKDAENERSDEQELKIAYFQIHIPFFKTFSQRELSLINC